MKKLFILACAGALSLGLGMAAPGTASAKHGWGHGHGHFKGHHGGWHKAWHRPPGWDRGRKVGWGGRGVPPGWR